MEPTAISPRGLRAPELLTNKVRASLQTLTTSWRGDFFGGTIAALIAVPYGMALALAIGLPPEAGLYTSIIGGFISGMLSDAPIVVSGLSATIVPILAQLVRTHGIGAALAAGVLSGLLMILIGALRLGRFFRYLPQSVVAGFTSGLGLIIVASQLKAIFRVKPAPASFDLGIVDDVWGVLRVITQSDLHTVAIAALVVAIMFLLPLWKPNVPASLIAVIAASLIAKFSGWPLPLVGTLPDTFPLPNLNNLDFSAFSALLQPALALAGLITINQLLTVVVTDRLQEVRGEVRFNRELVAQGLANVACPFFGAPPGVAMLARTVASHRAGAVTRWSVLAHSAVLLLFLLPMRNLISQIPIVVLAAVTVAVGLHLVELKRLREIRHAQPTDALLFLLTFGLVVFADLIVGVGIGAMLAMLFFVEHAAQTTRVQEIEAVENAVNVEAVVSSPDVQIYRLTGPLFFASGELVLRRLSQEVTARKLILDLSEARPIDSEAADSLTVLAQRQHRRGGELHLIGLDPSTYDAFTRHKLFAEVDVILCQEPAALTTGRVTRPLRPPQPLPTTTIDAARATSLTA